MTVDLVNSDYISGYPLINYANLAAFDTATDARRPLSGDLITVLIGGVLQSLDHSGTLTPLVSAGNALPLIVLQDQKAQNTSGGTFTSSAWQTRTLNTEVVDTGNHCTLSSNHFVLDTGTYRIRWSAPAFAVDRHQTRLQNTTDSATIALGTSDYANNSNSIENRSIGEARFTISASKNLEIQHQCATTKATSGFGVETNLTTEIYTTVWIEKE